MTRDEAIMFFGSPSKLARVLCVHQSTTYGWLDRIPPLRQLQIEAASRGALRAGPECDLFRVSGSGSRRAPVKRAPAEA